MGTQGLTHLKATDSAWLHLHQAKKEITLGFLEICEYRALFLDDNDTDPEVQVLLDALKKEVDKLNAHLSDYSPTPEEPLETIIDRLREKHVVIVQLCSC